mmetsp:Transcript_12988/g.36467  ORF Transcript_12988/g.36467 Transcript_12988/m.36467 type:complete len:537 (-) Transcript_12988:22-1632(-)
MERNHQFQTNKLAFTFGGGGESLFNIIKSPHRLSDDQGLWNVVHYLPAVAGVDALEGTDEPVEVDVPDHELPHAAWQGGQVLAELWQGVRPGVEAVDVVIVSSPEGAPWEAVDLRDEDALGGGDLVAGLLAVPPDDPVRGVVSPVEEGLDDVHGVERALAVGGQGGPWAGDLDGHLLLGGLGPALGGLEDVLGQHWGLLPVHVDLAAHVHPPVVDDRGPGVRVPADVRDPQGPHPLGASLGGLVALSPDEPPQLALWPVRLGEWGSLGLGEVHVRLVVKGGGEHVLPASPPAPRLQDGLPGLPLAALGLELDLEGADPLVGHVQVHGHGNQVHLVRNADGGLGRAEGADASGGLVRLAHDHLLVGHVDPGAEGRGGVGVSGGGVLLLLGAATKESTEEPASGCGCHWWGSHRGGGLDLPGVVHLGRDVLGQVLGVLRAVHGVVAVRTLARTVIESQIDLRERGGRHHARRDGDNRHHLRGPHHRGRPLSLARALPLPLSLSLRCPCPETFVRHRWRSSGRSPSLTHPRRRRGSRSS